MGYFHEGHLSLMRRARKETDRVVVSLFVNPAQFGPREDFRSYPRDFKRDLAMASKVGVDVLFAPPVRRMYPEGYQTFVKVEGLSDILEGAARPIHFRGVTTVVCKLFHLVQPDIAYFGQKDYQQARLIQKMVKDLDFDVKVKILPTVREPDGLAMSSRNIYLNPKERKRALSLFSSLQQGRDMIQSGTMDLTKILRGMKRSIERTPGVRLDYLKIVDPVTLEAVKKVMKKVLLVGAIGVGKTRLIDNLLVE